MTHLEWELENLPHIYKAPKSDEYIDRVTLTHVICNVDRPDGVDNDAFYKVLNQVAKTLDKFPYFNHDAIAPEKGEAKEFDGLSSWWYMCGACHSPIDRGDRYCRSCGKKVRWDG